ncbi:MAG: hypothetical protein AABW99_02665 [archaeon]
MNSAKTKTAIITAMALILLAPLMAASAAGTPTISGIPDITITKNSGNLDRSVDLRDYAQSNEGANNLFYTLTSQSNNRLIDCFIESERYVSCNAPGRNLAGMNSLTITITDSQGRQDSDSFNVTVKDIADVDEIIFEAERSRVTIEPANSIGITFTVENSTREKQCFETGAVLDSDERDEIKVTPSVRQFCLNSGEKTSFSTTITSLKDARTDSYDALVQLDYGTGVKEIPIEIEVIDNEDPVDITRISDYYVCKEPYTQEIRVRLENNSGGTQTIRLNAEHQLLLPVFEFPETTLSGGESDEMNLIIHTNKTTAPGEYTIPVFARSEDQYVERSITFRLVECNEDAFTLNVSPNTATIERNGQQTYTITLTGNIDEGQYVSLSADSDLETQIASTSVFLPAYAEKKVKLIAKARGSDKKGEHKIIVYAWNAKETEQKEVRAEVKAEHKIEIFAANNDFDARVCSATSGQTFEIIVRNNGDYAETVKLGLENVPRTIQAVLSDKSIEVDAGKEKKMFVFINPAFDAPLGDYTISLVARAGNITKRQSLRFRVVEAQQNQQQNLAPIPANQNSGNAENSGNQEGGSNAGTKESGNGFFTGFAAFSQGEALLGGVMILILLLAILIGVSLLNSNKSNGDWVYYNRAAK